jgi:hypothetical protein
LRDDGQPLVQLPMPEQQFVVEVQGPPELVG